MNSTPETQQSKPAAQALQPGTRNPEHRSAFTLIELLVVIAIIGVLAGLLFPITAGLKKTRMKTVARAELAQIETLIQSYKGKTGFYPPDNAGNSLINPLYFELSGATFNSANNTYTTLDGVRTITTADLSTATGNAVTGIANSGATAAGSDDKPGPINFLKGAQLKPGQLVEWKVGTVDWRALVCSVGWAGDVSVSPTGNAITPWQYRSSSPTNNPGAYDLWVDIYIDGKTNRISNWSKTPQIVY
jgi:prepilin-type N-terminal cleavage/methylation domain-containing protein